MLPGPGIWSWAPTLERDNVLARGRPPGTVSDRVHRVGAELDEAAKVAPDVPAEMVLDVDGLLIHRDGVPTVSGLRRTSNAGADAPTRQQVES